MEKFLRAADVAEMLGTTRGVAASILAEHGVKPVDFGRGRGRGLRWLESAVNAVMHKMHDDVQPKARPTRQPRAGMPAAKLADMSVDEIYRLTTGQSVQ